MKTIAELEEYLEKECYSFNELIIGKHRPPEGIVIQQDGQQYIFGYSERGSLNVFKTFKSEKELVDHAIKNLENNKWNKAHLVAWAWTESDIIEAENELKKKHIIFERNDIPNYNREHPKAYRLFVFGKDILLLSEFMKKYIKR